MRRRSAVRTSGTSAATMSAAVAPSRAARASPRPAPSRVPRAGTTIARAPAARARVAIDRASVTTSTGHRVAVAAARTSSSIAVASALRSCGESTVRSRVFACRGSRARTITTSSLTPGPRPFDRGGEGAIRLVEDEGVREIAVEPGDAEGRYVVTERGQHRRGRALDRGAADDRADRDDRRARRADGIAHPGEIEDRADAHERIARRDDDRICGRDRFERARGGRTVGLEAQLAHDVGRPPLHEILLECQPAAVRGPDHRALPRVGRGQDRRADPEGRAHAVGDVGERVAIAEACDSSTTPASV